MTAKDKTTYTNIEYDLALPSVQRNRIVVAGERAVKAATTEFLPPTASMCCTTNYLENGGVTITKGATLSGEGRAEYNKYLSLASFYGATAMTIDLYKGLIFSKDAVTELPNQIDYLKINVDGKGTNLRDFESKLCKESFITPWHGVLCTVPDIPTGTSRAQVEQLDLKPRIKHYPFESIKMWDYTTINNSQMLSFVMLQETESVRDGFKFEQVTRYRVLELINGIYHQSILDDKYEVVTEAAPVIVAGKPVSEIPFYFIDTGDEGKAIIEPLVDMNIHHYQVSADYNGKNYYSSFTIYYETGANDQTPNNMIGNGVKWSNSNEGATYGILQPDGNNDALRISMQDDEKRMAALGAKNLEPRTSMAESAEAKNLDNLSQTSITADVAITVSNIMTKAMEFCLMAVGGTGEVVHRLNTDYVPAGLDANKLNALVATYQGGSISYQTLYENMLEGEIANPDRSAEEELALIAANDTGMTMDNNSDR